MSKQTIYHCDRCHHCQDSMESPRVMYSLVVRADPMSHIEDRSPVIARADWCDSCLIEEGLTVTRGRVVERLDTSPLTIEDLVRAIVRDEAGS